MTPMTCCPALLTGLFKDDRELLTESGPFFNFFLAQISCVYLELSQAHSCLQHVSDCISYFQY